MNFCLDAVPTTANVITYSFLSGEQTPSVTPYVNLLNMLQSRFLTRRLGTVPAQPTIMVANCGKHGNWVTMLPGDSTEHPVFHGYSTLQVAHAWLKQDGTLMIGSSVARALETILKRTYPRLCTFSMTWQALDDVVGMIGDVNTPTTLLGKIPSMAQGEGQIQLYHAHLQRVKEKLMNMAYK